MPDAPCPHFGQGEKNCGGCTLQHLGEADYRAEKMRQLSAALDEAGLAAPVRDLAPIPPQTRRRIAIAAQYRKKGVILGYHARESHDLVNIEACLIAKPELVKLFPPLRLALAGWLRRTQELNLTLTLYPAGIDLLITGPAPDLEARETMADFAHTHRLARIAWRADEREESEPLIVRETPTIKFGETIVAPAPGAFLQPSAEGEAALADAVLEAIDGIKGRVADLFAGCGTFGLRLPQEVTMIEGDKESCKSLAAATQLNNRAEVRRRDLFRDPLTAAELNDYAAVVLDPPRVGAKSLAEQLARSEVPAIAYVSCNPRSFARDARSLTDGGYRCEWIQPVDQFVWSAHLELVARFSRAVAPGT